MRKKIFTLLTLMLAVCSGAWAEELCYVDFSGLTIDSDHKKGTKSGTNCTMDYSVDGESYTFSGVKYYKFGSSSNVKITLTNGSFQAGDVLTVNLGNNASSAKTLGFGLKSSTDTKTASVPKVSTTNMSYTLKAADINDDGSISIYRSNSNGSSARYFSFSVSGDRGPSIQTTGTTSLTATESGVAATTNLSITGKALTANGTLTAEFTSSVSGLSVSFGSNTTSIDADGAISTSVTVSYSSTVNVPTGTAYLRISDGTTNKNVAITYSASVTSWTLQSVNTTTTWDWSKITMNTSSERYVGDKVQGIELSESTTPSITTEFVMANYDGIDYTLGSDFDGTSVAFTGQYPIRKNQYCQNGTVKIKAAVPGKIVVKFSDTGSTASATAVKRYLVVNGEQTEYWTSRENNNSDPEIAYAANMNVVSGEIAVPVGDVTITGSSAIIINYITFIPTAEKVGTASGRNYASYVTIKKLDFASAEGITAYIATGFNGAKNAIVLKKVDVVPAGTAIIVKTDEKGGSTDVEVTTDDPSDVSENALVAGDGTTAWNGTANYTYYYLAGDLFHKATSGTLQSGKAYLKVPTSEVPTSARDFGFVFEDDATGIDMVQNSRFTENGAYYNLNGQRIAQPTKGLYIVNGKKVVIK